MPSNLKYWEDRQLLLEQKRFNSTLELEKEIDRIVQREVRNIEDEMNRFLLQYAQENSLTYQQAEQLLTKIEFKEYKKKVTSLVEEYHKNPSPKTLEQLKIIQSRRKVTRMQSLKDYLNLRSCYLSDTECEIIERHLMNQYEDQYLENLYNLQDSSRAYAAFDMPSISNLKEVVNYPYSGELFSTSVWTANEQMVSSLIRTLQTGMVQGLGIDRMARSFEKLLRSQDGVTYNSYSIRRILRTESAFVQERANTDSMKQYGTERYVIITAKDERTCKRCGAMHDKSFKVSDEQIGVNSPPFHPMCRCTKTHDILTEEEKKEIDEFVSNRNMAYEEWKSKYGKGKPRKRK